MYSICTAIPASLSRLTSRNTSSFIAKLVEEPLAALAMAEVLSTKTMTRAPANKCSNAVIPQVIALTSPGDIFSLAELAHRPPATRSSAVSTFTRTAVTVGQFFDWWSLANSRFPRLSAIATCIIGMCPSEACVERVFSKMKHLVGKLRTNLRAEAMEAQLVINSAIAFDQQVIDVDNWKADEAKLSDTVVQWILTEATPPLPQAPRGHRMQTRKVDDICTMCERLFKDHALPQSVECDICKKWYALECVGIPAYLLPNLAAGWECNRCMTPR